MSATVSISEVSVVPPQEVASTKIDKSGEKKVLEEEGSKNGENVQHFTDLPVFKCTLDLNEPVTAEERSDNELNQFLSPVRTRSGSTEPQVQEPLISTKSEAVNGIDLNMSPLSAEEKERIFKTKECEQPGDFVSDSLQGKQGSGPSGRVIVQALPCSRTISFFEQRYKSFKRSLRPKKKKKSKRGAKPTRARKRLNLDLNVGIDEDESLGSLSEVKIMTSPGKRRRCKPRIESDEVMKTIVRTRSQTRGSFLDTEKEELEKSAAAEVLVDI